MATKATKEETLELQDGTKLVVRPLNIKNLRLFMKETTKFENVKSEEENLEVMLDATQVVLKQFDAELAEDRDRIEELFDVPNIWKLFEVAAGVTQSGNPMAAMVGRS